MIKRRCVPGDRSICTDRPIVQRRVERASGIKAGSHQHRCRAVSDHTCDGRNADIPDIGLQWCIWLRVCQIGPGLPAIRGFQQQPVIPVHKAQRARLSPTKRDTVEELERGNCAKGPFPRYRSKGDRANPTRGLGRNCRYEYIALTAGNKDRLGAIGVLVTGEPADPNAGALVGAEFVLAPAVPDKRNPGVSARGLVVAVLRPRHAPA